MCDIGCMEEVILVVCSVGLYATKDNKREGSSLTPGFVFSRYCHDKKAIWWKKIRLHT